MKYVIFSDVLILNNSPVVVARHFQYRVDVFFTGILMSSDLLGEIKHYAIRVEFRFRGSSYIHYFLWILNPVKLSKETIKKYVAFLDQTIH